MEGPKFRTPYDSISVGRDSWSKEICEIHSSLHELLGNPTRSKPTMVEFPRFCGENPELWISKAERYFDFYEIAENHKLSLASSYLDGVALSWYQWLLQNKQLVDWEHFTAKVLVRFPKLHLESLENHLANQMPSMTGYSSHFEAISWGFSKTNVLFSCPTHVYTQWRSKNNPALPQKFDMQSECKSKMDAHNMFDEMSIRVFTEEVEETSSSAILLGDLDYIQSTRVLDKIVHSCCHKLVAEDLSISSKLKALTDYTLNTKLLILLGSTSTFRFIANANFMNQVWDPGQQRYELVVRKLKVDNTYSDVNRVFDDSSQRDASRDLQPIAPLHIICLPKLFQFLQQLLAQLIFVLQAPKSNVWLYQVHGGLVGPELRNFSTLAELKGLVGAQGDKIIVCPPTLSLYEVVTLQTYQNDNGSLCVIESELELVKVASIVVAYVVHKAILSESKSFSVLASCWKFKTMLRLMCYVFHAPSLGHRCIEECTVAQQVLKSNPVFKALNNVDAIQIKFSSHNGIFVEIKFAKLGKTLRGPKAFSYIKRSYCLAGITDAHDSPNIEKVMNIVGLSKAEQVTIFKILASVMMLSNMDLAKGNEIVSSILYVDNTWFHVCTTIASLYTHSSLERFNIILSVWLHSNLEGKVLIGEGSIVMNGPKSVMVK
ncbi:hypothetical protein BC332_17212 [Capsicum chinense]|nr:hypothetical protein BC332_17212 [Capsicum chinense]